jgi:acyl carrier protein
MTARLSDAERARITGGFAPMPAGQALTLFDAARGSGHPVVLASAVNTGRLRARAREGSLPALWRGLINTPVQPQVTAADPAAGLTRHLATLDQAAQQEFLLHLVRTHAAIALGGSDAETVDPDRPFREIGFDSLTAVDLRNRLAGATGLKFPATLVFDHPTPAELASHVRTQLAYDEAPAPAPVLEEIESLEKALLRAEPDEDLHARVTKRLQMLAWRWEDRRPSGAPHQPGDLPVPAADDVLDSATDEQIFALLDGDFPDSSRL